MRAGVVIVAAGRGKRMRGAGDKLFTPLNGVPLLALTMAAYQQHPEIEKIVLVAGDRTRERFEREVLNRYGIWKVVAVVPGGERRQDSVFNGLKAFADPPPVVLIHDGDRPFVGSTIISSVLRGALQGGAIAAVRIKDTVKKVEKEGVIVDTPARDGLWLAQTPQGFPYKDILSAHERAREENWEVTDDASIIERMGKRVRVVEGSYSNIKITTPEDLVLAEAIYRQHTKNDGATGGEDV